MTTPRLLNKTAIITGGTTGIGFETAQRYIQEGAKVLITGRSEAKVNDALTILGSNATGIIADSTSNNDLSKLAEYAQAQFAKVDILFVNAGNGMFATIDSIDEQAYDQQFDLNVKGVFFTVQKILPLLDKGSNIILTASAVHEKGFPAGALYFASKAAVRSFARSMAAELGPKGIRVNSLSPGIVPTQFFANSNLGADAYGQFEAAITASAPLARAGSAGEIANAAVFLGSDDAAYITAEDLVVDGGWMNI